MRGRAIVSIVAFASGAGAVAAIGTAVTGSTDGSAAGGRLPASVTLRLQRTGLQYPQQRVSVGVRERRTSEPVDGLRVSVLGTMNLPGHRMATGPAPLRDRGSGLYASNVDFYMPGRWRIVVRIAGKDVAPSEKSFDRVLK